MTIYLVRHGQDDPTVRGGWSQASLTDEGRAQVADLLKEIAARKEELNIRRILASDLPRTLETAQPIADLLGLELELCPKFREVNNGILAGMPNEEADEKFPGLWWSRLDWDQHYTETGESPHEFFERISKAWQHLVSADRNENILLVTHGGPIHVISCLVAGETWSNKTPRRSPKATLIPIKKEKGEK